MPIFDSHFHLLSMKKKGLETTLESDIIGIDVGTDLHDISNRLELIAPYENLQFSQGIGPWAVDDECYEGEEKSVCLLMEDFKKFGGAFIGECGLDYHWMYGTKEKQEALFNAQIELSNSLGLPIIIHTRDADDDIKRIITDSTFQSGGIMHCFSSGWEVAQKALDKGLMISFSGNVTYKSNTTIKEVMTKVPLDMLLFETDSPYLAPVPFRGKPSRPEMTELTAAFIAQNRGICKDDLKSQVLKNFRHLLELSSNCF